MLAASSDISLVIVLPPTAVLSTLLARPATLAVKPATFLVTALKRLPTATCPVRFLILPLSWHQSPPLHRFSRIATI